MRFRPLVEYPTIPEWAALWSPARLTTLSRTVARHHITARVILSTRRDATLIPREANICRAKAQPVLWYRLHVEAGHVRSVTRADWRGKIMPSWMRKTFRYELFSRYRRRFPTNDTARYDFVAAPMVIFFV